MSAWRERIVTLLLLVVAVVNLLPGMVALDPARAVALYGFALDDPSLALVMRHRALLIAAVGALLALAAFRPALRTVAIGLGLASMLAFIALYAMQPAVAVPLVRVAMIDVGAVVLLLVAVALSWQRRPG